MVFVLEMPISQKFNLHMTVVRNLRQGSAYCHILRRNLLVNVTKNIYAVLLAQFFFSLTGKFQKIILHQTVLAYFVPFSEISTFTTVESIASVMKAHKGVFRKHCISFSQCFRHTFEMTYFLDLSVSERHIDETSGMLDRLVWNFNKEAIWFPEIVITLGDRGHCSRSAIPLVDENVLYKQLSNHITMDSICPLRGQIETCRPLQ